MSRDKDYIRLINTNRWKKLRHDKLDACPHCEMCSMPATEVHHRAPVETGFGYEGKERLMFDPSNLMSVCHKCHAEIHMNMGRTKADIIERQKSINAQKVARFWGKIDGSQDPGVKI